LRTSTSAPSRRVTTSARRRSSSPYVTRCRRLPCRRGDTEE
jgi:hypothetical protein